MARFGARENELVFEKFKNLRQDGTLEQYCKQFALCMGQVKARIPQLSEDYFVECYISGVQEDAKQVLKLLGPATVEDAMKKARLCAQGGHEWQSKRVNVKPAGTMQVGISNTKGSAQLQVMEHVDDARKMQTLEHPSEGTTASILTKEHKSPREKTDIGSTNVRKDEDSGSNQTTLMEVSIHAIEGVHSNRTITLTGTKGQKEFSILVYGGSTHSFLDEGTARKLKCEIVQTTPMQVMVANGNHLISKHECTGFSWKIGDQYFQRSVRTLPLGSYDLVLGVDWLGSLGPVTFDFTKLLLQFHQGDKLVTLQGNDKSTKPQLQQMSAVEFVRSCERQEHGFLYVLFAEPQPQETGMEESATEAVTTPAQKEKLKQLLSEYEDIFKQPDQLPPHRDIEHSIELKEGAQPFSIRPYRNSYDQKNEIEKLIGEMLESGVIRPSSSPFASPILLVKKKDGTWRFCIDYRKLNSLTIKNKFPIPLIEELLDELSGEEVFSKLDLRAGYHQVRMKAKDIEKTAFRTHLGHYEFTVMPFGLTNAPASFQSLMNQVFAPYLRKFTLVFFDDILIYSKNVEEHLEQLEVIFKIMRENKLFAKMSKCDFLQSQVAYLGHVITREGVAVDKNKIRDMMAWPVPKSVKALRGFLGLSGYYKKFVKNYGLIAKPLTSLLQKDNFFWNEEAEKAFQELKQALVQTPVLKLPDYTKVFTVESDASNTGIGAVLTQEGRPLAYFSKALGVRGQAMSTYEKELTALVTAVKKWTPYLMDKHFFVKTDHWALKFLTEQKVTTLLQQKWISKLMGYNFTILYRKGKDNTVADALSRMHELEESKTKTLEDMLVESDPEDRMELKGEGLSGSELVSSSNRD